MQIEKDDCISAIKTHTGIHVNRCYQCGKCSAGCAVNEEMDYPPNLLMRMLQTGDEENYNAILHSQAIWLCLSCQNCVTRCPMEIDIPRLMDYLKEKALEKGCVHKKARNIVAFHRSFLDSVRYTGRLYEIGLVGAYKMRSLKLFQDLTVAPGMFMRGKLPLIPEMTKDRAQISDIFSKTHPRKKQK